MCTLPHEACAVIKLLPDIIDSGRGTNVKQTSPANDLARHCIMAAVARLFNTPSPVWPDM